MTRNLLLVVVCLIMVSVVGFGSTPIHLPDSYGQSNRTEGSITVGDDIQLNYVAEGRGVPCIVVGSSIYYPQLFSKRLKKKFRFIFVDERAMIPGLTKEQSDAVTLDTLIDDMEAVRIALGYEKVAVMGHSVHALFAFHYASKYPQHTSHVIMVGVYPVGFAIGSQEAALNWENNASDERKAIYAANLEQFYIDIQGKTPAEIFILDYVAKGPLFWYDANFNCAHLWEGVEVNMNLLPRLYTEIFWEYDFEEHMKTVTAPIFVATGLYDFQVPHYLWDDIVPKYPQITYHLFKKSGHTPFYEVPKKFNRKLIRFLKKTKNKNNQIVTN